MAYFRTLEKETFLSQSEVWEKLQWLLCFHFLSPDYWLREHQQEGNNHQDQAVHEVLTADPSLVQDWVDELRCVGEAERMKPRSFNSRGTVFKQLPENVKGLTIRVEVIIRVWLFIHATRVSTFGPLREPSPSPSAKSALTFRHPPLHKQGFGIWSSFDHLV